MSPRHELSDDLSDDLIGRAEAQHWVLSRAQLRAGGVSRWQLRDQVRARRWRLVGRHAVLLHRGQLTKEQRCQAYVLHAGTPALISGRTALTYDGLSGWDDSSVCILVPKSRNLLRLPGLVVHETRRWPTDNRAGVPRTTIARAAIDASIRLANPRSASGLLAAIVQQRLETAERLYDELQTAGKVRHAPVLRRVLIDIAGGAQAMTEIDFARLCRAHGLPEPVRQRRRRDASGRWRYLDAEWVLPSGQRVVAEVDGGLHLRPANWWSDMARDNAQQFDGAIVLRFPSLAIWTDPETVVAQLRRALAPLLNVA